MAGSACLARLAEPSSAPPRPRGRDRAAPSAPQIAATASAGRSDAAAAAASHGRGGRELEPRRSSVPQRGRQAAPRGTWPGAARIPGAQLVRNRADCERVILERARRQGEDSGSWERLSVQTCKRNFAIFRPVGTRQGERGCGGAHLEQIPSFHLKLEGCGSESRCARPGEVCSSAFTLWVLKVDSGDRWL